MGQSEGKQRAGYRTPNSRRRVATNLLGEESKLSDLPYNHTAPPEFLYPTPKKLLSPIPQLLFSRFQKQPTILFNERHIYEQSNDPHKNFIEGRKNKLLAHDRGRSLALPAFTLALCRLNPGVTSFLGGQCRRDGVGAKGG